MILEPNVPNPVRKWAVCRVGIRKSEYLIERLSAGSPTSYRQVGALKTLGRAKFIAQVAEPELRRLERRCRRYRVIAQALETLCAPQKYLLDKRGMLEMIGNTLHFSLHHNELYMTLQYCSPDGERLFGSASDECGFAKGIDALALLSLGFGRA